MGRGNDRRPPFWESLGWGSAFRRTVLPARLGPRAGCMLGPSGGVLSVVEPSVAFSERGVESRWGDSSPGVPWGPSCSQRPLLSGPT